MLTFMREASQKMPMGSGRFLELTALALPWRSWALVSLGQQSTLPKKYWSSGVWLVKNVVYE